MIIFLLKFIIKTIFIILPLLIGVAYLTLAERKVMASMQQRKGPNVVGIYGLLQPLADGLKLLLKETIIPDSANQIIFIVAPIITFTLSLISWIVIPFDNDISFINLNVGILYLFCISSLGVYGIIMSGWSSNSKYAFLGGLRSSAQMISYEVCIGFVLITIIICVGSLNLNDIVLAQRSIWFIIPHFPIFLIFLVSILAETNRAPFDLPEAEAELVAGYNVEYSAMGFALFFLGEYSNILLMSSLTTTLFLGGWLQPYLFPVELPGFIWFSLKTTSIAFFFIWVRATFPRYRYDQLMYLGWKVFLPFTLAWLILTAGFLVSLNGLSL
uniref:NADH-ubiquinone oxidoreductase chain 1 n=1 Tax=Cyanoptyche gloeocystis TaxID=77922 RepID=A0A096Y6Y4_9EUKA|nr:NADH dehydrogenase subunit 1 [Cyanoptyche gloeocystis]AIM52087.1 NADH dehydrogenase subunit 1 [Cyanoptyche gloeocystis]